MTDTRFSSRRGFLVLMGSGLLVTGCTSIGGRGGSTAGAQDRTAASLPLVNKVRAERGLSPLTSKTAARTAAAEQAVRMAKAEQMTHLIGFGDSFLTRMKRSDVPLPAAENIASGQHSVEEAVQAWIDSQRHLTNMIGSYSGLGVAVAQSSASRTYWAMVLSA
jgi:uncharacterized protein YkwD